MKIVFCIVLMEDILSIFFCIMMVISEALFDMPVYAYPCVCTLCMTLYVFKIQAAKLWSMMDGA